MSIIVQKFGGTSVANKERLENVAKIVRKEYYKGNKVVVVVSAQSGVTDKLKCKADEISNDVSKRELDVLLSSGEQITIALLCMMLEHMGIKAISYTGWQLPIITDNNYSNASIEYINTQKILKSLDEGKIVVIAGFQGIDNEHNITTLGRGGSDLTAVALAAYLKATSCDIYTDVDGIYTSDPNVCKDAKKIDVISYDDMIKLTNLGAKVLHNKCVEYAKQYNVVINVKSSFKEENGSVVKNI